MRMLQKDFDVFGFSQDFLTKAYTRNLDKKVLIAETA
jgi:hypothetical protein